MFAFAGGLPLVAAAAAVIGMESGGVVRLWEEEEAPLATAPAGRALRAPGNVAKFGTLCGNTCKEGKWVRPGNKIKLLLGAAVAAEDSSAQVPPQRL